MERNCNKCRLFRSGRRPENENLLCFCDKCSLRCLFFIIVPSVISRFCIILASLLESFCSHTLSLQLPRMEIGSFSCQ